MSAAEPSALETAPAHGREVFRAFGLDPADPLREPRQRLEAGIARMDGLLKRSRRRRRRGVRDLETFNGQLDQLEEKLFELGEAVGGLEEIVSASERPRSLPEACSVCTREPQGQQNASCADDPLSGCDPEKTCWGCFEDWFQHRVLALARAERAFDEQYQTSSRGAATAARQLEPQLPDLSRMIRHYARPRERRPAAKRALGTRSGQDPGGGDDDPEGEPAGSSRLVGAPPTPASEPPSAVRGANVAVFALDARGGRAS